jgi:hypothetical protein
MHNPIQNEAEGYEPKYEGSFGSIEAAKPTEDTSMSTKNPDTTLSMIVLLLACLALAALAHVIV